MNALLICSRRASRLHAATARLRMDIAGARERSGEGCHARRSDDRLPPAQLLFGRRRSHYDRGSMVSALAATGLHPPASDTLRSSRYGTTTDAEGDRRLAGRKHRADIRADRRLLWD